MSEDEKKKEDGNIENKEATIPNMETAVSNHMVITIDGTEGRKFTFSMPFHTPLQECYNAAVNAANRIACLYNETIEKQKEIAAKKEEDKKSN